MTSTTSTTEPDTFDRTKAEKNAAKRIDAVAAELKQSAALVASLTSTVQDALSELDRAARAHDALVRATAAELVEKGLVAVSGEDHQSAGSREGAVRLRGQWWRPLSVGELRKWVFERTCLALDGHQPRTFSPLESRGDGLLDAVKAPAVAERARQYFPPTQPLRGAPVGMAESERRAAARRPHVQTTEYPADFFRAS